MKNQQKMDNSTILKKKKNPYMNVSLKHFLKEGMNHKNNPTDQCSTNRTNR